jgi:hypothetical protein
VRIIGAVTALAGFHIPGVGVNHIVVGPDEAGDLGVDAGSGRTDGANLSGAGLDADVGFHPAKPLVAHQRQIISGSRAPSAFFGEECAAIIVASAMLPPRLIRLCPSNISACGTNSLLPSSCLSSRYVQQRRGVGALLDRAVQPQKPGHRIRVVDRVLNAFIRQREPRLQQVHPQRRLQRLRLPAPLAIRVRNIGETDLVAAPG